MVKLASPDPISRATGISLRNYEREVKFYNEIANTLDVRKPHCYFADWHEEAGDIAIVLEDMTPCEQGDQIRGCGIDEARISVTELSKLHGPRWGDASLSKIDWLQRRDADDAARLEGLYAMLKPGFLAVHGEAIRRECGEEGIAFIETLGTMMTRYVNAKDEPFTVTHGDYRLDNCMVDAQGNVIAVLDWEICTLGDPMADLGLLMVYWTGPNDDASAWSNSVCTAKGFLDRADLARRYAETSGRDISQLDYYVAFAYWKLACIIEGVYARYLGGALGDRDPAELEPFKLQVDGAAQKAASMLEKLR